MSEVLQDSEFGEDVATQAQVSILPTAERAPAHPEALAHRNLLDGPFWQRLAAYAKVPEADFLDHQWQAKNSITNIPRLLGALAGLVSPEFIRDAENGFHHAPMPVRVSPYLLSLIDWSNPWDDPLRIQFIPLLSRRLPDHPKVDLDPLHELQDMPVPGLTHRYPDKALFLPVATCPVYCRFCTRSYAVGLDTEEVHKLTFSVDPERWRAAIAYVASRPELEDILISGGDATQLRADQITFLGESFLAIPHVRRIRIATKGLAVLPQKFLTDDAWTDAITGIADKGRKQHVDVMIHTHINHPNEITSITKAAADKLCERGILVRNQAVLLRGVNDDVATMGLLAKRLSYLNIHPYYVYVHDMVKGVEELRTTVATGQHIEKQIRGLVGGFNMPTFVVDTPGGGKREVHSHEHYDRETGVSVWVSPVVHPGQYFCFFDPIHLLPAEGQARWARPEEHDRIVEEALAVARSKA
ncbi:MAG: KamA family radical SAM protein [Deltaproteobacteria bacterium]|nr:KamA family radical SAM protein [Deltaproteobacteria bacterium]